MKEGTGKMFNDAKVMKQEYIAISMSSEMDRHTYTYFISSGVLFFQAIKEEGRLGKIRKHYLSNKYPSREDCLKELIKFSKDALNGYELVAVSSQQEIDRYMMTRELLK